MSEDMTEKEAQDLRELMKRQHEMMVSMWWSAFFSVLVGFQCALDEWEQWEGAGVAVPGLLKIVSNYVAPLEESEKRRWVGTLGEVAMSIVATCPKDKK
jgi:hypothetical protein